MIECKLSKEDFYNEIKRLYKEYGNINCSIFKQYSKLDVNFEWYSGKFGGINKIKKELGIPINRKKITTQDLETDIKNIFNQYQYIDQNLYSKYGKYSISSIKQRFGSFNKCLKHLNLPIKNFKNATKEDIEADFKQFYDKYKTVSSTIYRKYGKYSCTIINRLYGNYTNFLEAMHFISLNKKIGFEKIVKEIQILIDKYGTISKKLVDENCSFSYEALRYYFKSVEEIYTFFHVSEPVISNQVTLLTSYLKDKNIYYEKEVTWDWLINDKTLRNLYVDIFLPDYNLCIEVNGEQHYKYKKFFHNSKEEFENQIYRDNLKKSLIIDHHINFLEIKYDEDPIKEFIKFITVV